MRIVCICWALLGAVPAFAAGYGFDVGTPPGEYAAQLSAAGLSGSTGSWMRVRGVAEGRDADKISAQRAGLLAVRARGVKTLVLLRWDPPVWAGGTRTGGGHRLPVDLREAFERGRWLGTTYGDVVDGWEIDNEPDIDFCRDNPETYAAFFKATYLGLKAGTAELNHGLSCKFKLKNGTEAETASLSFKLKLKDTEGSEWLARKRGGLNLKLSTSTPSRLSATVIMAAPALPPGPYFERLGANGLLSYTDGFNFHYYGYADDFSGVYRQFEAAVAELGAMSWELGARSYELGARSYELGARSRELRRLPVFVTEYGYGLLDAEARNTVEGRARQWQWFANVAQQLRTVRPEGPLAFLLNPYYEAGINEFGLTQAERPVFLTGTGSPAGGAAGAAGKPLVFTPADFGARSVEPWMRRIGQPLGTTFASPALAYLWDYAERHPYRPRTWAVKTEAASPVVIDFVADAEVEQWKSGGGYLLNNPVGGPGGRACSGRGRVVAYNFSAQPVAGQLAIPGEAVQAVTLAAGERREWAVELRVQAERFVGQEWAVTFSPADPGLGRARWVTRLYPDTEGMRNTTVETFNFPLERTREQAAGLAARPVAVGEPRLQVQGRWLATEGVRVSEAGGIWRFQVDYLPAEALRPAVVELPLPAEFKLEPGQMLVFDRRSVAAAAGTKATGVGEGRRSQTQVGQVGARMEVYFRMANGNLYQTWPRLTVTAEWAPYAECTENFTMAFFGRAGLPWRFFENRPVGLVFFLRPAELPAVFEVRGARLVRVGVVRTAEFLPTKYTK